MFKRLRSIVLNLALICVSLAAALLLSEFIVRHSNFTDKDRAIGAKTLFGSYENTYTRKQLEEVRGTENCSWSDTLVIHPYLGWVHRSSGPCSSSNINNRGFPSRRDMPLLKDPEFFSILIVGGSVASQFAGGSWNNGIWLEEVLNKNYKSPNGKPFRVLMGAFGAWKYPTQNIAVTMFGDVADAVVALDGYNESLSMPLDSPDLNQVRRISVDAIDRSMWISFRTVRRWRDLCVNNSVLKNSYLALLVMRVGIMHVMNTEVSNREWAGDKVLRPQLPFEFSKSDATKYNKNRFKHYVRLLNGEAKTLGLKFAHFLQPVPDIAKKLTAEEIAHEHFATEKTYTPFMEASDELSREGIASYSLVQVFSGVDETIYGDEIHCAFDNKGDSRGYEIIADAMAKQLAKTWNLRMK